MVGVAGNTRVCTWGITLARFVWNCIGVFCLGNVRFVWNYIGAFTLERPHPDNVALFAY